MGTDVNELDHEPGPGQRSFSFGKRDMRYTCAPVMFLCSHSSRIGVATQCSSIFVEPMVWMRGVVAGELEGKVSCERTHPA